MKGLVRLVLLGVAIGLAALAYDRYGRPPGPEELDALRSEHQTLSERLRGRLAASAEPKDAADASIVVGVPAAFAERLSQELSAGLLSTMKLTLREIEVEKSGELDARLLLGRSQIGAYHVRVFLDEVHAVLRAGAPQVRLASPLVGVVFPVTVTSGAGKGRLSLRWDGRGVAGGVCGDFEVAGDISGTAIPSTYRLRGRLALAMDGPALVARPELDDAALSLRIEPSAETWALVDKAIEARGAVCRAALGAADVPEKLRAIVDRGFVVKLPRRFLPELRFPVEMERAVDVEGGSLRFQVRPAGLAVTASQVWYRTDVRLLKEPAAAPLPPETPTPVTTEVPAATETETPGPTDAPETTEMPVTPGGADATSGAVP